MANDEQNPSGKQSAKQFVDDLRDTVGKKVADNESSLRGGLGKAARWFDGRTGGKYSQQIGRAESRVGDGIGWAASQGAGAGTSSGAPGAPGAGAGDPTVPEDPPTGPVGPPVAGGPVSNGPVGPGAAVPGPGAGGPGAPGAGPGALAGPDYPDAPRAGRPGDPPMYPAPGQQPPQDPPTTPR